MTSSRAELAPQRTWLDPVALGVWFFALLGCVWRLWVAHVTYPWTGDPIYSYAYRAMLIADGQLSGAFLMWHPPGYPLLLGSLTWLGGGRLSPYAWGVVTSALTSVALVIVVDRLAIRCVEWPWTRLAIASFVACYETLVINASAPLTEPAYMVLLYSAVLVVGPERPSRWRLLGAGALLGAASTTRWEGTVPFAALVVFLAWSAGRGPDGFQWRPAASAVVWLVIGWLLTAGWLYLNPRARAMRAEYSIDLVAKLRRVFKLVYVAFTTWLPHVMMLPYWILAAFGVAGRAGGPNRASRVNALLLAAVVPGAVAVVFTIMHKRIGTFILPAAAIWIGLGLEVLAGRVAERRRLQVLKLAVGAFVIVSVALPLQISVRTARDGVTKDPVTMIEARLLEQASARTGYVWSFGAESQVYYFWRRPVPLPRPDKRLYDDHRGHPETFVDALRRAGFEYLAFALRPPDGSIDPMPSGAEPQSLVGDPPLRRDLERLAGAPETYGLTLLGRAPAERSRTEVYVFRIGRQRQG